MRKAIFLVAAMLILTTTLVFAEEIRLTTIVPGGSQTTRTPYLAIGNTYSNATTYPDTIFTTSPDVDLLVEGNVGIGTTAPNTALDLTGAFSMRGMSSAPAVAPGGQGRIYFDSTANHFVVSENGSTYTTLAGGGGPWTTSGNNIYNNNSGNVGIGYTDPGTMKLAINGNVGIGATTQQPGSEAPGAFNGINGLTIYGTNPGLILTAPGYFKTWAPNVGSDGTFRLYGGSPRATCILISNDGMVSIHPNTSSFSYRFQVRVDDSYEGHVTANGSWGYSSDLRLKKNISSLKDSLSKILELRPVIYDGKTDPDSPNGQGKHTGFIAQELEKVIPDIVSTDTKGYKAIAYADLTPFLTEAIQEQQKEIKEQQAEIKELKSEVAALKKGK